MVYIFISEFYVLSCVFSYYSSYSRCCRPVAFRAFNWSFPWSRYSWFVTSCSLNQSRAIHSSDVSIPPFHFIMSWTLRMLSLWIMMIFLLPSIVLKDLFLTPAITVDVFTWIVISWYRLPPYICTKKWDLALLFCYLSRIFDFMGSSETVKHLVFFFYWVRHLFFVCFVKYKHSLEIIFANLLLNVYSESPIILLFIYLPLRN